MERLSVIEISLVRPTVPALWQIARARGAGSGAEDAVVTAAGGDTATVRAERTNATNDCAMTVAEKDEQVGAAKEDFHAEMGAHKFALRSSATGRGDQQQPTLSAALSVRRLDTKSCAVVARVEEKDRKAAVQRCGNCARRVSSKDGYSTNAGYRYFRD